MTLKGSTVIALFLCSICLGAAKPSPRLQNFAGHQVLRATPKNIEEYQALAKLYNEGRYDFWSAPSNTRPADIMASPIQRQKLIKYFRQHDISYTTFIEDVERVVEEQRYQTSRRITGGMNWDDYQELDTIYKWLDILVKLYPNLISMTKIGESYEGRDLKVFKISTGGSNKTAFWMDATIHAREWISTSTLTYIINQLVTNSIQYTDILNVLDFYVLPMINPDGYVYSHTTDRMWRKTRSKYGRCGCYGVDANRNFGFRWGGEGSSDSECSTTYRGHEAYSEPETLAMKNYIESQRDTVRWDTYITIHSYSQLWMLPWGYTNSTIPDHDELQTLGDAAAAAIKQHYGTDYRVGNAASILYLSSGSSRDWAKGEGGFKYVYTIELRDTGEYGFLLPADQIIPTAIETWSGIQVIARHYSK